MTALLAQCIALLHCLPYLKMRETRMSNAKITIPVAEAHGIWVSVSCQFKVVPNV